MFCQTQWTLTRVENYSQIDSCSTLLFLSTIKFFKPNYISQMKSKISTVNSIRAWFIVLVLIANSIFNQTYAQSSCGQTTANLVEPNSKTTLCTNGSDAVLLNYNSADNTSTLPNYAYVVEGQNGLAFLETGDPPLSIEPAGFGSTAGDTLCISGVAYDIEEINGLISTLSNGLICGLAGIDLATCQIIAELNAQGGLISLNDALDFSVTLGSMPPSTIAEAITLLVDIDSQASALGGVCFAVSNNGAGNDYCYIIENCCAPETIVLNNALSSTIDYLAVSAVCLDVGFEVATTIDFYADIENCQ